MVREDREDSAIQEILEMLDRQMDAEEFTVKSGIDALRFAKLAAEDDQRSPHAPYPQLQDRSQSHV